MRHVLVALILASLTRCGGGSGGNPACGITALAGATMLLDEFQKPRQTLSAPPAGPSPGALPVRVAAGPAYRGLTRAVEGHGWIVAVEGTMPDGFVPGFGVLVVSSGGVTPRGVMLYTGRPIQGAPAIGSITVGTLTLPLLGLETGTAGLETPDCPFFPDSLARP